MFNDSFVIVIIIVMSQISRLYILYPRNAMLRQRNYHEKLQNRFTGFEQLELSVPICDNSPHIISLSRGPFHLIDCSRNIVESYTNVASRFMAMTVKRLAKVKRRTNATVHHKSKLRPKIHRKY